MSYIVHDRYGSYCTVFQAVLSQEEIDFECCDACGGDGIGGDERFWRLAQALSALYPSHTDEKRWVDGVLARKKSLGF